MVRKCKSKLSLELLPSGHYRKKVKYVDIYGVTHTKSITGTTELEVLQKIDDFKKGRLVEKLTVRKAIRRYIDAKSSSLQPTSISSYECILRNYFQPLMEKDIQTIKPIDVQQAINTDAKDGKSTKTIKSSLVLLKAALTLNNAPLPRYKYTLPPQRKKKADLPDFKKLLQVINSCDDATLKLACLLSINCGGMRIGEVRGLQYGDIFEKDGKKYIHIERQRTYVSGIDILKSLKTDSSERDVPLPKYLYEMIMAKPHNSDTDFIIDEEYQCIHNHLKKLLETNGINNFTFHSLRKVFATKMSLLGVQKEALQLLGGWANSVVLDSVYICTPKDAIENGISQLSQLVEQVLNEEAENVENPTKSHEFSTSNVHVQTAT